MASTSRTAVRTGIATYFGGTFDANTRSYRGGPLQTYGVGVVRAGYPKELNMRDAFEGMPAGRMSGAVMVVVVGDELEVRQSNAGPPVHDGASPPNITAGGIKRVTYQVELDCFHISQERYAEDAQADVDAMIEAIKQQLRLDRTMGGICIDGGETKAGIRTKMGHSGQDANKRTLTNFTVAFEVRVNFIA